MKNTFLLYILFAFIFSCKNAPDISTQTVDNTNKALSESLRNITHTLISAHRGGSGIEDYPENALETIDYLHQQNIKIFEIDVMQTTDGELMLMHDDNLERTTTGTGSIRDKSSTQLLEYNLVDDFGNKTKYKIPFLKDVLKWTKNKDVFLMIDFKRSAKFENVIDLIREYNVEDQCILISYSVKQAKKLHKLAPEMQLSVSARNDKELNWILNTQIPTDKMIAFTGTRLSDKTLYKRLSDLKIPSILGTLGNLDKKAATRGDKLYKEWADLGIQIFATDRPIEAYKALQ